MIQESYLSSGLSLARTYSKSGGSYTSEVKKRGKNGKLYKYKKN